MYEFLNYNDDKELNRKVFLSGSEDVWGDAIVLSLYLRFPFKNYI